MDESITITSAFESDADELYEMQIKSFKPLLDKYQDYKTNPGAEKINRIVSRLREPYSHYYFIRRGGVNIGAVRVFDLGEVCLLKQIYILPEYQGRGYAQQAILLAEALHKNAVHWELDTIKQESKLCHLYEKMGYARTGQEERVRDGLDLVVYRK